MTDRSQLFDGVAKVYVTYDSKGRMHPPVACSWCFKRPVLRCSKCHRWLCENHAKDHAHPGKSRKEKEGKI